MGKTYKDEQKAYRVKAGPRLKPKDEWDEHDDLFMSKATPWPRKKRRQVMQVKDRDFTKPNQDYRRNRKLDKDGNGLPPFKGHVVNDYRFQRQKHDPTLTNHQRHVLNRQIREGRKNGRSN